MTTQPVLPLDQVNAWMERVQTTLANAVSGSTDAATAFADVLAALQDTSVVEPAATTPTAASDSAAALADSTLGTADASDDLGSVSPMSVNSLSGTSPFSMTYGTTGTSTSASGSDVVLDAMNYLGVPYQWGGTNPSDGLDCSALVQRVYGDLGYTLPRVAHLQQQVGVDVGGLANAQPGDMVFFGQPASHVGIYVGNGYMIDAPHTGADVRVESIANFGESVSSVRRIIGVSPQLSYASLSSTLNSTSVPSLASFLGTSTPVEAQ